MNSKQTINQRQMDTSRLILYYYPTCPFCVAVLNVFDQMDLDIELRNIFADPQWRQELIQGGGKKTVPCLRIEDDTRNVTWMYESREIIYYLRELFGA